MEELMSISDTLCYFLNHYFEKLQHIRPIYHNPDVKEVDSLQSIHILEFDRGPLEWSFYSDIGLSLKNKILLDVGCGYGGRSVYYASMGAKVIAIDIKPKRFKLSNEFAKLHNVDRQVTFQIADAAYLPFKNNSFDVVMSNNAMQYISNPLQSLNEFKRVVKPDGLICINFGPPWYAPICPEAGTAFPWSHLLFSQETIKKAFKRMGKEEFFTGRMDDIYKISNQFTIKSYRKLLTSINLKLVHFKLWTRPYVAPLLRIPFFKEFFCTQIISVTRKKSSDTG
jgi:ubiquinone/menaquinone biosynthesis C-methylase UbiE